MLNKAIKFFVQNKLIAIVFIVVVAVWGTVHAPFDLGLNILPSDPVSIDAIPDIGENQQIVFTEWPGQSPQDIENQITYPLTTRLLGIPGVKTVRSSSMFGFSSIYVIFDDDIEFYWSRSRILEKLNSLPKDLLPRGVQPALGPDATALGQIFWYTLEGRDEEGRVTGGWDLQEIRSTQDFFVKNALSGVQGVSEVSSIGGFVQEYQVDAYPELLRQYNISLNEVARALQQNNQDVGAKTMEINRVEYFVRGLGYINSLEDIRNIAVSSADYTPIYIKDIANVALGPAERRGILDKGGAEVAGGVVVARYGANPMQVINRIKDKIREINPALPVKTLSDGRTSRLTIVPFYDRGTLIRETLATLGNALGYEILITLLIVVVMLYNLRVSLLVSSLMPIVVLMVFIAMKLFQVDANILALSGIAIAIGTMVDMAIILTENVVRHINKSSGGSFEKAVYKATKEVSGAILTAGLTTIISFIPVFSLSGPEGKLFTPLAFTKTVALSASMVVALFIIPPMAILFLRKRKRKPQHTMLLNILMVLAGLILVSIGKLLALLLLAYGVLGILHIKGKLDEKNYKRWNIAISLAAILLVLGIYWRPFGYAVAPYANILFVVGLCAMVLGIFYYFKVYYTANLRWALRNKGIFLSIPLFFILLGIGIWRTTEKEFMPSLDEGAFMIMPTSMPHAGISEIQETLKKLDMAVSSLPEIETVMGKAGRVESAIDPAPLSMYENLIVYKPEYIQDSAGNPIRFKTDGKGNFITGNGSKSGPGSGSTLDDLIEDPGGEYYRNWRPHIRSKADIWNEIVKVSRLPGITSSPKLQPIETRLVMLQSGMRATMGIKVKGQDLDTIQAFGLQLEELLRSVEELEPNSVYADRTVGKPYLEVKVDREKIARYGLSIEKVQEVLEIAVGGKLLTETIEGRERYGVRLRYPREMRANPDDIGSIDLPLGNGGFIPLRDIVSINYEKAPQNIKSEDGFLTAYVLFDKKEGISEVTAVEKARELLEESTRNGDLRVPEGLTYEFSGNYINQRRSDKRLSLVIPLVLIAIFLILYLQFRSVAVSLFVFVGVAVAFSGGFLLIWLYGQAWFMDIGMGGLNFRELFHIKTVNLSVAVWVGFIALFGIATDDGVVMATYLDQIFIKNKPSTREEIRFSVIEAGNKRIRPCLMTTATTILALFPILASTGRGSDVMIPMAIPCFGGMLMAMLTLFVVPVLYCWKKEVDINKLNDGK